MAETTISIIIPVYKAASTIKRCVDSIVKQSETDWHLILVDDGSPDKSGEICDSLAAADSRISVIHKPNGGAGSARNAGLDQCHTRWVTFIDADDTVEPEYLANFNLRGLGNQTDIIIMQGFRRVTPALSPLGEEMNLSDAEYSGDSFMERAFSSDKIFEYGQAVGKLYDTSLIERYALRFTTGFQLSEDHLFYLSYLCHACGIITRRGMLYNYIWEEGSVGLSRRLHPYVDLHRRFMALTKVCNRLKKLHPLSVASQGKMDYFAITGSISLLLRSMYRQNATSKERTEVLNSIMADSDMLRRGFRPNGLSGKIVRQLLLHSTPSVADRIFSFVIR